jgi:hypothetical protein
VNDIVSTVGCPFFIWYKIGVSFCAQNDISLSSKLVSSKVKALTRVHCAILLIKVDEVPKPHCLGKLRLVITL